MTAERGYLRSSAGIVEHRLGRSYSALCRPVDCADLVAAFAAHQETRRTGDVGTILSERRDATGWLRQIARGILRPAGPIVSSWDSGESTDTHHVSGPGPVMCRFAGHKAAVYFVSNQRTCPDDFPDCADLADLKACSSGDSKTDVSTIDKSAQSAFAHGLGRATPIGIRWVTSLPDGSQLSPSGSEPLRG